MQRLIEPSSQISQDAAGMQLRMRAGMLASMDPLHLRYATFAGQIVRAMLAARGLTHDVPIEGVDADVVAELIRRVSGRAGWSATLDGSVVRITRAKVSLKPTF
jgi:hypothetical protein